MALDLNYKPKVLVDTATLTEEEWLDWRKKGIGGSQDGRQESQGR